MNKYVKCKDAYFNVVFTFIRQYTFKIFPLNLNIFAFNWIHFRLNYF